MRTPTSTAAQRSASSPPKTPAPGLYAMTLFIGREIVKIVGLNVVGGSVVAVGGDVKDAEVRALGERSV